MVRFSLAYVFTSFSNGLPVCQRCQVFEYHTFLHHSQTAMPGHYDSVCLSTIRFYIILKPCGSSQCCNSCLSTIRFYIILKHARGIANRFSGLSTIRFYIILKLSITHWIGGTLFEYHTFLHHSQTALKRFHRMRPFEYHTFLHHSQT